MRKTAFIYCRISQDRTGEGLGVDRQESDCRELAERLGYDVTRLFVDNDISASSGRTRPSYAEMLSLIKRGAADAIICWAVDRLHRVPRELENYIDACREGKVTTHAVKMGEIDLSTPAGMAVARTLGAWARYESDHKSDRQKRSRQQAREQGKFTGGPRPFGWDIVDARAVPNEREAAAVKLAASRVLAGKSIASIAAEFESRGILPLSGRPTWRHTTLRDALVRPKLAGLMEVDGDLVNDPSFPALLTEDEWLGVRAILTDPSRQSSFDNRNKWLLSNIAECECGSTVVVGSAKSRNGNRRAIYRCKVPGPGHVNKQAVNVDKVTTVLVEELLRQPDASAFAAAPVSDHDSTLSAEANGLRARMSEAALMAAEGDITMAQLKQINERLRTKLADLESAMAEQAIASSRVFDAAAKWTDASLEKKRQFLAESVRVRLLRGNSTGPSFNPNTVEVTLK